MDVSPTFSKTSFHLALHHELEKFDIESPAKITFPEENMVIHIVYNETVYRTIRLLTSESVENLEENDG